MPHTSPHQTWHCVTLWVMSQTSILQACVHTSHHLQHVSNISNMYHINVICVTHIRNMSHSHSCHTTCHFRNQSQIYISYSKCHTWSQVSYDFHIWHLASTLGARGRTASVTGKAWAKCFAPSSLQPSAVIRNVLRANVTTSGTKGTGL